MKFIPDDINIDFMGARKKAFVLSGIVDWDPLFRTGDMLLALGLAVLVGFGASAMPARRASRLDPVAVLTGRRR